MNPTYDISENIQSLAAYDTNPDYATGHGKSYFSAAQQMEESQYQQQQQQRVFRDKPVTEIRPFPCMSFKDYFTYLEMYGGVPLKDIFVILQFERTTEVKGFTYYLFNLIDVRRVADRQSILNGECLPLCKVFTLSATAAKYKTMAEKYTVTDKEHGKVKHNLFCLKEICKTEGSIKGQDEYFTYYKFIYSPVVAKNTKTLLAAFDQRKKEYSLEEDPEPVDVLTPPKPKKSPIIKNGRSSTTPLLASSTTNPNVEVISEEDE